jgi:hypothetical protein
MGSEGGMGQSTYQLGWARVGVPARRALAGAVVWALLAAQSQAVTLPHLPQGDVKAALAVCATEREPLVELQSEYAAVSRAKLTNLFTTGAKAGLTMLLASNPLFSLASSAAKQSSLLGGGQQRGSSNPNDPDNIMVSEALSLKIPGVEAPPTSNDASGKMTQLAHLVQPGQAVNDNTARTLLAISMIAAIGGQTDVYIRVKQQQYSNDAARISKSIESDAVSQIPVGEQTATQVQAVAECRKKQVAEFREKLAAASEKEKKALLKTQATLKSAVATDLALGVDLATMQATVARVLTQGRAMAENKSEADLLNPQAPAYSATASNAVWQMPPMTSALGMASGPPPAREPPKVTLIALRNTTLRATPDPKAKLVMTLAVGHKLTPTRRAAADVSWWEVDVAGTVAYIRADDLADPSSVPPPQPPAPKGKKGKGAAAAAPPPPPPPSNVRLVNVQAIAVRAAGEPLKPLVDALEPTAS